MNKIAPASPHPEANQVRDYLRSLSTHELLEALTVGRRQSDSLREYLPLLPPEAIQAQFTGLSEKQTFQQALTFLEVAKGDSRSNGTAWGLGGEKVLDFGCGWGRITQLLGLYFNPKQICGVDVQNDTLQLCRKLRVDAEFLHVKPWPPAQLRDGSFDYIFAYSVFSHLSEDCADAWIREFSRILKPGGTVFLTTRHRSFFNHLASLRLSHEIKDFAKGAAQAFVDQKAAEAAYDRGMFCFDHLGSGGPGLTVTYGEAAIPFSYAKTAWQEYFRDIRYHDPVPSGLLDQSILILNK